MMPPDPITMLIVFGFIFMLVEALLPAFGVSALVGLTALILGALSQYDAAVLPAYVFAWHFVLGFGAAGGVLVGLLILLGIRITGRFPLISGAEGMRGAAGTVIDWQGRHGHVLVQGERWQARGAADLAAGDAVVVETVSGLALHVRAASEFSPASQ